MKLNELKHNHSLTDLLKILLFAILMLAPIGMVATRCLYVIFNKNAYQSYSDNTSETLVINDTNDFNYNVEYYFTNSYLSSATSVGNSNTNRVYIRDVEIIGNSSSLNLNNTASIGFYQSSNSIIYYFYDVNNTAIGNFSSNTQFKIKASITSFQNDFGLVLQYSNTLYKIDNANTLDNVFEYSVSQLEESNLFNWTENTAIFSGIQTMTTELGITNQTIPILLTYWFLLTVIYIIIDIILKLFTYMTHALGNRKV